MVEPRRRKLPEDLERELDFITSLTDLEAILQSWLDAGIITLEEASDAYETQALRIDPFSYLGVPEEARADIRAFTSKADLADRIARFGFEPDIARNLYQGILSGQTTSDLAMREAQGRSLAAQVDARAAQEKLQFNQTVAKFQEEQVISNALRQLQRIPETAPALTQLQPLIEQFRSSPFQEGLGEGIIEQLTNIQRQAQRGRSLAELRVGDEERASRFRQQARAEIFGMRNPLTPTPSPLPISERIAGSTGLGQGSRLADFFTSELLRESQKPDVELAREQWWRNVGSDISQSTEALSGQARQIALRRNPLLSSEELMAEDPLLRRGGFGIGADPLWRIFNEQEFRNRFFRRPGAGLAPSKTPAVRFR